jgi:hypothetical protein
VSHTYNLSALSFVLKWTYMVGTPSVGGIMKKTLTLALTTVALCLSAISPTQAQGYRGGYGYRGYGYHGTYYNNSINPWAAAAVGAVIGAGIGAAVTNSYAPPAYYPPPVVVAPPVVVPYPQPYAVPYAQPYIAPAPCRLVRVPIVDQYGRIIQYQQVCAH